MKTIPTEDRGQRTAGRATRDERQEFFATCSIVAAHLISRAGRTGPEHHDREVEAAQPDGASPCPAPGAEHLNHEGTKDTKPARPELCELSALVVNPSASERQRTDAVNDDHTREAACVSENSTTPPSSGVVPFSKAETLKANLLVTLCMTCGDVQDGGAWRALTEAEFDRIWLDPNIHVSHGSCPQCAGDFMEQARRLHRQMKQQKQLA